MKYFPENTDVPVEVNYTNAIGEALAPSSATAVLLDGDGVQIVDLGAVSVAEPAVTVTVPLAHNALPQDAAFDIRILEVSSVYPEGTVKRRFSYVIETEVRLEIMKNTFMMYEYADATSRDFIDTSGWLLADENTRKTALIEAFKRLTYIPMKWVERDEVGQPIPGTGQTIPRYLWPEIDADAFKLFSSHFKRALRRAQFIEANNLLKGNTIDAKRRAGIVSETIGESSVKLSDSIVDYGVCSETLSALAGYVHFNMKIGRG